MMAAKVEIEPADYDRQSRVCAHCNQEECTVLEMFVFVGGQQDCETSNAHCNRDQREQETMFEEVREVSDDESEDERRCPWWHAVQLGADLGVPVRSYDCWSEEGIPVGGDNQTEVHEASKEEFVVLEAVENVAGSDSALSGGTSLVFLEARLDICTFVFT